MWKWMVCVMNCCPVQDVLPSPYVTLDWLYYTGEVQSRSRSMDGWICNGRTMFCSWKLRKCPHRCLFCKCSINSLWTCFDKLSLLILFCMLPPPSWHLISFVASPCLFPLTSFSFHRFLTSSYSGSWICIYRDAGRPNPTAAHSPIVQLERLYAEGCILSQENNSSIPSLLPICPFLPLWTL